MPILLVLMAQPMRLLIRWLLMCPCLSAPAGAVVGCGPSAQTANEPENPLPTPPDTSLPGRLAALRYSASLPQHFWALVPLAELRTSDPFIPKWFSIEKRLAMLADTSQRGKFSPFGRNGLAFQNDTLAIRVVVFMRTDSLAVVGVEVEEMRTDGCNPVACEVLFYDFRDWERVTGNVLPELAPEDLLPANTDLSIIHPNALHNGDVLCRLCPTGILLFSPCFLKKGPQPEIPTEIETKIISLAFNPITLGFDISAE